MVCARFLVVDQTTSEPEIGAARHVFWLQVKRTWILVYTKTGVRHPDCKQEAFDSKFEAASLHLNPSSHLMLEAILA